jgi:hypothetical protein
MRIAAYLFFAAGLVALGFGLWLLYARFIGGPEFYLNRPDESDLRRVEEAVAGGREKLAELERKTAETRAVAEARPAGDELRARAERVIADAEKAREETAALLAKAEELRDRLARKVEAGWDEARGRTLRLGVLGTLLGLVLMARTAGHLRRPADRPVPDTSA